MAWSNTSTAPSSLPKASSGRRGLNARACTSAGCPARFSGEGRRAALLQSATPAVGSACGQVQTVRTVRDAPYGAAVAGLLRLRLRGVPAGEPPHQAPAPDQPVVAAGHEGLPVRAEGDAADGLLRPLQGPPPAPGRSPRPTGGLLRPAPPEAKALPSGLKATPLTPPSCAEITSPTGAPSGTVQRRMVPSSLADASIRPSGLKATLHTLSVCPTSGGPRPPPLSARHSRTV